MTSVNLEEAVKNKKRIRIIAYSVSDYVEKRIKDVLNLIFRKHEKPDMIPVVYTCLKELLVNAVKANFKNIYFEGYKPLNDANDELAYDLSLKLFKLELTRENASHLEEFARRADIKAEVCIQENDDSIHIMVTNPVEMTDQEKMNVARKLECASRYNDITEYFMELEGKDEENEHDEGAGLGIILISMMMRNMGASQEDFTITSSGNRTTAYLKIPLANHLEFAPAHSRSA